MESLFRKRAVRHGDDQYLLGGRIDAMLMPTRAREPGTGAHRRGAEELSGVIAQDLERWGRVIKAAGIRAD